MKMYEVDDPRLTAYVLGELDSTESETLEAQLATDETLRREVQEIRAMIGTVSGSLASEPAMALTPMQRQAIAREPKAVLNSPSIFRASPRWIAAGAALAACLALAFTAAIFFRTDGTGRDQFAIENNANKEIATGGPSNDLRVEQYLDRAVEEPSGKDGSSGFAESRQPADPGAGLSGHARADAGGRDESREKDEMRSSSARLGAAPPPPPPPPTGAAAVPAPTQAMPPAAVTAEPSPERRSSNENLSQPRSRAASPRRQVPSSPEGDLQALQTAPAEQDQAAEVSGAAAARETFSKTVADDAKLKDKRRDVGTGLTFIEENPFISAIDQPFSTFSADVDTASYSNIRRSLVAGLLPNINAVRLEEMINYFTYNDDPPSAGDPQGEHPFNASIEISSCPWQPKHRLVRIGIKAKEVPADMRPATSLVFLIDVSGSMRHPAKLPLVKDSLKLLVNELTADDRIAIVTYAGQAGLELDSLYLTGENKPRVLQEIDDLQARGGTNGAGGIQQAYDVAQRHFIKGGVNRVLLCTDGDFNVGVSSEGDLVRLIQERRLTGVYLSVLGFGSGNYQEAKMQQLAKHGNGNFAYIDSIDEARKALIEQMSGTLVTVAKDVKLQADFNPAKVNAYRLLGYENRMLRAEDFKNDLIDAGEIGAGHSVTALYEIVPVGVEVPEPAAPKSAFIKPVEPVNDDQRMLQLNIRYKLPEANESVELSFNAQDEGKPLADASPDFKFASAVASFGMLLRDSKYKGGASYDAVIELARAGIHQPEVSKTLAEAVDDARHYTLTARPDLALSHFQAIEQMEVDDVQLAAAVDRSADSGKQFDEAIKRAVEMPELSKAATRLNERVMRGRQILGNYREDEIQRNHRNEFIELVKKAKEISGSN